MITEAISLAFDVDPDTFAGGAVLIAPKPHLDFYRLVQQALNTDPHPTSSSPPTVTT